MCGGSHYASECPQGNGGGKGKGKNGFRSFEEINTSSQDEWDTSWAQVLTALTTVSVKGPTKAEEEWHVVEDRKRSKARQRCPETVVGSEFRHHVASSSGGRPGLNEKSLPPPTTSKESDEVSENKNGEVRILRTIEPEGVNMVQLKGGWEEIDFAMDSGATETVVGEEMLESIMTKEGLASKRGVEYEVANGVKIPNLGEKKFVGMTQEGSSRCVTAQVCEVNKALMSVKKVMKAGNVVVFDEEGSYIEDKRTKERMWMREENGMFMLKMWVKSNSGF